MNTPARRVALTLAPCVTLSLLFTLPAAAQVNLTALGTPYTQAFDTLAVSGTANAWADNSTLGGWYAQYSSNAANPTTYRADAGGSNAGAVYSWGTGSSTERAFGSVASGTPGDILKAVRLANNTGATITSIDISFVGEQWRAGGCSPTAPATTCTPAAQKLDFQYRIASAGTITDANTPSTGWTDHDALDFTSPVPGVQAAATLDGNAAANRVSLLSSLTVTVNAGQEIWLRWLDVNDANNDHGLGIDDLSITPRGVAPTVPNLTINDVTLLEGDSGTVTAAFTVSLSPAPTSAVTFDIATSDGTAVATVPAAAGDDYVASSLTGQSIAAGGTVYTFNVTVNGDSTIEPNETFNVTVTNVSGATLLDGTGVGTIQNDDVTLVKIGAIQGPGTSSPVVGTSVSTRGIVTAIKANGFFIQEAAGSGDGDPATSDGIFVFTSSAPAATIAIGDSVQVTGNVTEYFGMTELVAPLTITEPLPPAALPAPSVLTTTLPSAAPAVWEQLEHLEGMRVRVPSMTVVVPTTGYPGTHYTTGTTGNGIFYGVVTGVPRPMREAGFEYPDPIPAGSTIPQWDANPELIKVDSDALNGATKLDLASRTVLTEVVGPLDYTFNRYTILPDPLLAGVTAPPGLATAFDPVAVADPAANEFTVGSYNLQRFYDDQNSTAIDDSDENGTTAPQFAARLAKASLHVRQFMKTPDIVGLIEVEDLPTLQRLATQIDADAATDPMYASYLVEGNDLGGIDVGFLVKTAAGRVTNIVVTQVLDGSVLNNPDGSTSTLHDRPPLMLQAVVNGPGGAYPVTVILNHLRSLGDVDDPAVETPNSYGWPSKGARVRGKRLAQAVDLASFVQARQLANPSERIIVMGDMNAFEVNDGYVHSMGTITGTAYDPNSTLVDAPTVPGDGVDLVTPDLLNLLSTVSAADERYGYVFEIAAQNLDHMLVSAGLVAATPVFRQEHARVNADFHETTRSTTDRRLSDHDPVVGFFTFPAAGVAVGIADSPDPVVPGGGITYTIAVTNGGPGTANGLTLTDPIPAGTAFASLTAPADWSCSTPAVGGSGTVTCTSPSLAAGATAPFTLNVTAGAGLPSGSVVTNTVSVQAPGDSDPSDNTASATTTVQAPTGFYVTKSASGSFLPGTPVTYTIVLSNAGATVQADNTGDELVDVLPTSLALVSATATSGTALATVATNTVTWNGSIPAGGAVTVTIVAILRSDVVAGTTVLNQATASYDADGNGTNESSSLSDDPRTGAAGDPTSFLTAAASQAVIPVLDGVGLGLLAALVALGGALVLGRRLS